MRKTASNPRTAALITLVGGNAAVASGFLTWLQLFSTTRPGIRAIAGTDLTPAQGVMALGVGLIAVAALSTRGSRTSRKAAATCGIVLAALVLLAGGYTVAAPSDSFLSFAAPDIAEEAGPDSAAMEILEDGLDAGALGVRASIGSWLAVVAGVIALAGGILGVRAPTRVAGAPGGSSRRQ